MARSLTRGALATTLILLLGACASPPPAVVQPEPVQIVVPPVAEPIEEPPAAPPPPPVVIVQAPPAAPPPVNEDEQQAITLLADLQRYSTLGNDELRRELAAATQAANRSRTDATRIRLALLLTFPGTGAQDDARALALLDAVIGRNAAASPLKQLASVLSAQIAERIRGVRDEQRRTAAAQEKLDALRSVERSLLMERSRNGGGGSGAGGGGGGTGGGSR